MSRIVLLVGVLILAVLIFRLTSRSATPAEGTAAPDFTLPSQEGTRVSVDSLESHKRCCGKDGLHCRLLADTHHSDRDTYGSLTNLGFVKFAARHTCLIDRNGKIAKLYPCVDPAKT
jgi:peroxiredoxin